MRCAVASTSPVSAPPYAVWPRTRCVSYQNCGSSGKTTGFMITPRCWDHPLSVAQTPPPSSLWIPQADGLPRSRGRTKFLGADHRQQLELGVAVAAGRGGEDQQGLVLVEVVQHLAVHLEHAELGGPDALLVTTRDGDLVLAPQLGELGT